MVTKKLFLSGMLCMALVTPGLMQAAWSKSFDRAATASLKMSAAFAITTFTVCSAYTFYKGYQLLSGLNVNSSNPKLDDLQKRADEINSRIKELEEQQAKLVDNAVHVNDQLGNIQRQGTDTKDAICAELKDLKKDLVDTKEMQAAIIETSQQKNAIMAILKQTGSRAFGWLQDKFTSNIGKMFA